MSTLKEKNMNRNGQRTIDHSTAEMMMHEEKITIPCIIDKMDNQASEACSAWPDRIFVVRSDGSLAIAAGHGASSRLATKS